jgi:hypothetical protein
MTQLNKKNPKDYMALILFPFASLDLLCSFCIAGIMESWASYAVIKLL